MTAPAISLLGTSALLFEAPGETDLATQRRIWTLARAAAAWPETGEAVPGMNNLMLRFASPPRRLDALIERLLAGWEAAEELAVAARSGLRRVRHRRSGLRAPRFTGGR